MKNSAIEARKGDNLIIGETTDESKDTVIMNAKGAVARQPGNDPY